MATAESARRERIRAKFAAEHAATRQIVPPGWTAAAWALYQEDADGGRAPYRLPAPDTTMTAAEWCAAWED